MISRFLSVITLNVGARYTLGRNTSATLRTQIDQFVAAEAILQQVSNPSGTVSSGGLGEPKVCFYHRLMKVVLIANLYSLTLMKQPSLAPGAVRSVMALRSAQLQ
jgi:hypothetical protein